MGFAGVTRRTPFFLKIVLSTICCTVTLTAYLLFSSLTPTSISSKNNTLSHSFTGSQANLLTKPAAPHVYMIGLPRRTDRRDKMRKLQAVTGLSWTFIDATDSRAEIVGRIMERVRWMRASVYLHTIDAGFHGWWSDHQGKAAWINASVNGSELWELSSSDPTSAESTCPLPMPPLRDQRLALEAATGHTIPRLDTLQAMDTQELSFNTDLTSARAATRVITNAPTPRLIALPYWRVMTRGTIACWHSHIGLIRAVASETVHIGTNGTGVIILEDDVDMEFDIQQRIGRLWEDLPPGWDILFLGHCWSAEATHPAVVPHSQIHRSHSPKCTHAYALSQKGAQRIVNLLRHPQMAYSRPLDAAILKLIRSKQLNAYSVYPSVIIQTKDTSSDIFPGNGSTWREVLQDSALARVNMVDVSA